MCGNPENTSHVDGEFLSLYKRIVHFYYFLNVFSISYDVTHLNYATLPP